MAIRRGYRHQFTIDSQTVWLDSKNEALALTRFIEQYGFSGKWARPTLGITHRGANYTPDFELVVNSFAMPQLALIEVKQNYRDFGATTARRMWRISRHYPTDLLYLYAVNSDKWFKVLQNGVMRQTTPPQPGDKLITDFPRQSGYTRRNYYGRRYHRSFGDLLFSFVQNLFHSKPKPKRRRK